jgi:hypothetical protein
MKIFNQIDEETSIADYPGYVGMTWDGELSMQSDFKKFQNFDWNSYAELVEEKNETRELKYKFRGEVFKVKYEAYQDACYLIEELKSLEVHYDDGAQYGGMCSGRGYIFFLKCEFSYMDANEELTALTVALETDLYLLKLKS